MIDTSEVLITHEQIQEMLDRLAAELNRDYAGGRRYTYGRVHLLLRSRQKARDACDR